MNNSDYLQYYIIEDGFLDGFDFTKDSIVLHTVLPISKKHKDYSKIKNFFKGRFVYEKNDFRRVKITFSGLTSFLFSPRVDGNLFCYLDRMMIDDISVNEKDIAGKRNDFCSIFFEGFKIYFSFEKIESCELAPDQHLN